MFFGVGVSYRILYTIVSYLYVNCGVSFVSVGEEGAVMSAIVYSNYVVSVRSGLLFLLVLLGLCCFILLLHSLGLPYINVALN